MNKLIFISFLTCIFISCSSHKKNAETPDQNFYNYTATTIDGEELNFGEYKGKVVLVVNTASKCGFTPQFKGLEELYQKYKDRGFVVLGFPCNQFGQQDPGSNDDIASFCQLNYGVTFPMFAKIEVNGDNAHPLYKYLKSSLPDLLGKAIKWNFTKFLIARDGTPIKRYSPNVAPSDLVNDIETQLNKHLN